MNKMKDKKHMAMSLNEDRPQENPAILHYESTGGTRDDTRDICQYNKNEVYQATTNKT